MNLKMLDDIKHQVNQLRGNNEADLSRMETRIMMRIEDGMRNNDKIVRFLIAQIYNIWWEKKNQDGFSVIKRSQ